MQRAGGPGCGEPVPAGGMAAHMCRRNDSPAGAYALLPEGPRVM
jgi:hypothetical protein